MNMRNRLAFVYVSIVIIGLSACGPKEVRKAYDCECGQDAWKYIKGHEYGDFYRAWGYPSGKRETHNADGDRQVLYTWKIPGLFQSGKYESDEISIAFDAYTSTAHEDPLQDFGTALYFYCGNSGPFN